MMVQELFIARNRRGHHQNGKPGRKPLELVRLLFFLTVLFGTSLVFILTPSLFPSVLISTLLYFVFSPLIDSLERKGLRRSYAIAGVFMICGFAICISASFFTPRVTQELDSFQSHSNLYLKNITQRLNSQETQLIRIMPALKNAQLTERLLKWLNESASRLWGLIPFLASHLFLSLFLVPLLTFFLLNEAHNIRRSLLSLVPNRYFETVYSLISRILDEMGGYVSARIIEALLMTALVTAGCLAFQIPYAILFGVFAGVTNAIPYLGPVIGSVPGILLAILEPAIANHLFWIFMIYFFANLIDMVLIFPLVVARIVDLHPVVVVISVLLGSQWFGIAGMVLAVPITSISKILLQEIYSRVYDNGHESFQKNYSSF